MSKMQSKTNSASGLKRSHIIGYALGDLGGCMTFAIMGSFLTPYYTEVAGLTTASVATMFLVIRIWDAINDPLMGALLDKAFAKTKSGKGKFRPWMFKSAPVLAISAVLMYTTPNYIDGMAKVLVAFVTYILYEASYTMFNIPYGSLLSAMANNDGERATLSSARGIGAMIGNLLPLMAFPLIIDSMSGNPALGYASGITVCAIIGLISCLFSAKLTEERNLKATTDADADNIKLTDIIEVFKKNRAFNALCMVGLFYTISQYVGTTLGIYMYRDVLGALPLMSLAMFLGMPFSLVFLLILPKISKKFGIEKTVRTTQLIAVVMYVILFLLPTNVYIYIAGSIIAASFSGVTVAMQWGMVGEAIDYNEYLIGKRTEGSIYGTFNLMRRIGQAIGSSLAVALLGIIGYVPNAEMQAESVLSTIKGLVILTPAVFLLLCWATFKFVWNITPKIRQEISDFKNKIAEENAN